MKNKFEVRGNTAVIFLDRIDRSVIETIISIEDLAKAQEFPGKWNASWSNRRTFYVHANYAEGKKRTTICLHRFITNCPPELEIDHINHDTLNNTRENIRVVTKSSNQQNTVLRTDSSSGFKGVIWNKPTNNWRALITVNHKRIYLGSYDDPKQAAEVAHQARIKYMPCYEYHESRDDLHELYSDHGRGNC